MGQLFHEFGQDKFEFEQQSVTNGRTDVFVPCRILDEAALLVTGMETPSTIDINDEV